MSRRKKTRMQSVMEAPRMRPDAAGIDIHPEVIFVGLDPRKDTQPVRRFGSGDGIDRSVLDSVVRGKFYSTR